MNYQKGQTIGNYTVIFPIGRQDGGELYRVRNAQGQLCFLKTLDRVDSKERSIRRSISHPNVCPLLDEGTATGGESYFVTEFVSSESLSDRLRRQSIVCVSDTRTIIAALLRLLRELHTQGIAHQAISAQNILLDLTGGWSDFRLTNFAKAVQPCNSPQIDNDLQGVGRLLYRLIFGMEAERPLRLPNLHAKGLDDSLLRAMSKSLDEQPEKRFETADQFLKALLGQAEVEPREAAAAVPEGFSKPKGGGFADVAGMDDLKKLLNESVLYVLRDKERAERYRLTIPNGMLLYGPPGCGKTFIAERFAEEAGYNFRFVKSSDLASIYIHGTQEKIGELFAEARACAPCVLYFDEFEALVPRRAETGNASHAGEVNEFLSQLNNCGKDGVFVIATTNQPQLIDEAVLRRGRIDYIIYVPMPDQAARVELFDIHLRKRPCAEDIDKNRLARLTERYVASEIAFIVSQAALVASRTDDPITQPLLERIIRETTPRTTVDMLRRYESMRQKLEQISNESPRIGFVP